MAKSPDAFRTISEVAAQLETPAHVLRFWESKFPQVRPVKRAGGRRYYRPDDVALLGGIKVLLYEQGMTIKGVQKILRERGARHVATMSALPWDGTGDPGAPEVGETAAVEAPEFVEAEPSSAQVLGGPWPGAAVLAAEAPRAAPREVAFAVQDESPREASPPADRRAPTTGPLSLGRLRAALGAADAARIAARADAVAPLVGRLLALREGGGVTRA